MSDEKPRVTDQQYAANGLRRMAPGESKAAMDPKRVNGMQPDFSIDRENITEVDPATGEEIEGPKSANGPARAKTATPFRDPKAAVVDSTEMTGPVAEEAGAVQFVSASLDAPPPSTPLPLAAGMNAENIARLAQALSGEAENAPGGVGGENMTETVKEGPVEVLPAAATPPSPPAEDKAGKPDADAGQNAVIETAEVADPSTVPANKDDISAEATASADASDGLWKVAGDSFWGSRMGQLPGDVAKLGRVARKAVRAAGPAAAWVRRKALSGEDLEALKALLRDAYAELSDPKVRAANKAWLKELGDKQKENLKIQNQERLARIAARLKTTKETAGPIIKKIFTVPSATPPVNNKPPAAAPTVVAAAAPAPELPPNLSAGTQAAPNAPDQEAPAESGTTAPIKPAAPEVASAEAKTQPPQPEKTAAVSPGETGGDNGSSGSQGDKDPQQASLAPAFVTLISATMPVEDSEKSDPAQMFTRMLQNWQAIIQAIKDDPASVYQGVARFGDAGGKETEKSENAAAILGSISSRRNSDFKLDFRVTGNRFEAALDYKKGEKYVDEQEELAAYAFALGVLTTWKSPTGNGEIPLVIGGSKEFRKYFAQALQDPEMQKIAGERGWKKINFVTEVGKTTPDAITWTEEDGTLHSFNHIVFAPPAAKPAPAPPNPDPAEAPPANTAVDSSEAGQAKSAANPPPQPVNAGTEQGTAAAEVPAEKEAAKIPAATQAAAVGGEVIPPVKAASAAESVPVQALAKNAGGEIVAKTKGQEEPRPAQPNRDNLAAGQHRPLGNESLA
jgi:hypothetical protein